MKIKIFLMLTISAVLLAGCAGGGAAVGAKGILDNVSDKKFEVSKVQLTVAPKPAEASRALFDKMAGPYMFATFDKVFTNGLSGLLSRDLGITADYSQLRSNINFKTSQKAGFVWDPNLYAWQATKKFSTGKQTIEVTSSVPNPMMTAVETLITVKNGGAVVKEYKIQAVMNASVPDERYALRLQDYFAHIPELLSLGIRGVAINDYDMAIYIADFRRMVEKMRLQENPPEEDLKRMREMVTDVDPSSGIVIEDLMKSGGEAPAEEENTSGATLLD